MAWCETLWKALQQAKAMSHDNPWLAEYLRDMLFPDNTWVLESLVALDECGYKHLPSDLGREWQSFLHLNADHDAQ